MFNKYNFIISASDMLLVLENQFIGDEVSKKVNFTQKFEFLFIIVFFIDMTKTKMTVFKKIKFCIYLFDTNPKC